MRQGFGRLIRSMRDKGGVIILDSRYGFSRWLHSHLVELPIQVTFDQDQEYIMRSVLKSAGVNTEFNERRIDPFLETAKFDFKTNNSEASININKLKKAI